MKMQDKVIRKIMKCPIFSFEIQERNNHRSKKRINDATEKYFNRVQLMHLMKDISYDHEFSILDKFLNDCDRYKESKVLQKIKSRFVKTLEM